MSVRSWLDNGRYMFPAFTGGLEKDAKRAMERAERDLIGDCDECDERLGKAKRNALDQIDQTFDEFIDAGKAAEYAYERMDDTIIELRLIVETLASYMPFVHTEEDEERGGELASWCKKNLNGDWEELWLGKRLMLVILEPSDQVLFKMRWL